MHQEQCIKVICKGDLLSDAAAVEIPSGVVRAVNWLPHPQADVGRRLPCEYFGHCAEK